MTDPQSAPMGEQELIELGRLAEQFEKHARLVRKYPKICGEYELIAKALRAAASPRLAGRARPISEYHEDMGDVLWWKFPITEAPYVGSPFDLGHPIDIYNGLDRMFEGHIGGWPGYHTHFTMIEVPDAPPTSHASQVLGRS